MFNATLQGSPNPDHWKELQANSTYYFECQREAYFDLESWTIALLGLGISFIFWKNGKIPFAIMSALAGLSSALSWAYLYYELNCVELIGL